MSSTVRLICSIVLIFMLINQIVCPPVTPEREKKKEETNEENDKNGEDPLMKLEYHRYLREVVNVLEADETFKKQIENASVEDIKSGKIAEHLDLVSHQVRTQLDELKRKEIERLSVLISRKVKLNNLNGKDIESIIPKYLDHQNVNTFEKPDLEKLIKEASNQLEEIDKKKQAEFKKHEMEKEFEYRQHLEELNPEARKKAEKEHEAEAEKRKHHERINHPGSQDQLEEVWEKQDHLEDEKFDPKTFFFMHDINGDGLLDHGEIEAIFQLELDKIFNSSDPNYDPLEREAEMIRMRQHVFTEIDKDKDSMVSLPEFMAATKAKDFDDNPEWKTVEDVTQFDSKEFEEFSKTHEPVEHTTTKTTTAHHEETTNAQHADNNPKHP